MQQRVKFSQVTMGYRESSPPPVFILSASVARVKKPIFARKIKRHLKHFPMQNESLQENTGYWKSVARLIQLYNLLVPSHLEDHLIAALSELLNPGPSGHQPLPGSFHKKICRTGLFIV